jgi:hypothetical protein
MLVYTNYRWGIRYLEVLFAERTDEVNAIVESSGIIRLFQCAPTIASELRSISFYMKPFYTTFIDLSQDLDTIWRNFKKKSCRYEINRAEKIAHEIIVNKWDLQTYQFIRSFQQRKGLTPIPQKRFLELSDFTYLFGVIYEGKMVAAHIFWADYPKRARLLISATSEINEQKMRLLISALNRKLHWYEIQFFKEQGFRVFDFGGIDLNPASPLYSITQFKMSFGGSILEEYDLWAASSKLVRVVGVSFSRLRKLMRNFT